MEQIQTYSREQIMDMLTEAYQQTSAYVNNLSDAQFNAGTDKSWSAAGYLKHLILSVKPLVRGLQLPREQMVSMFGKAENGSMTFETLVDTYNARIAAGQQATSNTTPVAYRFPEDVTDEKAYLVDTWNNANQRLIAEIEKWSEDDLNSYQLPHPAIGNITIREMLYFTIYHNRMHMQDIIDAAENQ